MLLTLLACLPKVEPDVAPVSETGATPLLFWEVSRGGHVSHLLGTCHLGLPLEYGLPAPETAHLDHARVVITEADLSADPSTILRLVLRDSPGLAEEVGAEAWHRLTAGAPTVPATLLDRMHPWGAAVTASLASTVTGGVRGAGGAATMPMDKAVQARAEAAHIPVRHVETLEEQVALFSRFDDTYLSAMRTPVDPALRDRATVALDALCREGRTDQLDLIFDRADPTTAPMLDARNAAWIPKLLPELDAGGAFIAVGAGHMLGENGLVARLTALGFTVRQARTDRPVSAGAAFTPPAPAPAYDPVRAAAIAARLHPILPNICGPQSPLRQCFFPDDASCLQTTTRDLALCADQHSATWKIEGEMGMAELTEVSRCVVAGTLVSGLARGHLPDLPVCDALAKAPAR